MIEYILLGAVSGVAILLLLMRTNTGVVFLSLCAGTLLLNATGSDGSLFATSLGNNTEISGSIAKIALLVLPALVSAILLKKQVTHSKFFLTVLPAACTALLGLLLIVPLLSNSAQASVAGTQFWEMLNQYQAMIVTVGIVTSVVCVALTSRRAHHPGEKSKKHKH